MVKRPRSDGEATAQRSRSASVAMVKQLRDDFVKNKETVTQQRSSDYEAISKRFLIDRTTIA
jgi:hypothetical protein